MTEFEYEVLGIDPSLSASGIAHVNGALSTVKTQANMGDRRLQDIHSAVLSAAMETPTHHLLAVLEDLPVNAMSAGKTGQAQGVIRLALVRSNALVLSIAPATLKKFATDSGRADKKQLRNRYLMDTASDNKDDNQVDAYYLRQYGLAIMASALGVEDDYRLERLKPDGVQVHKAKVKSAWNI